jgi:hypothetical protein
MLDKIFAAKPPQSNQDELKKAAPPSGLQRFTDEWGGALIGTPPALGEFYFPDEIIAGCCPRIKGQEREIAWNAAAEASDTERIHLIYHADGEKVWFLATRSSDLHQAPHSWCPFASLLPGMKDATTKAPVVYSYFTDEVAMMMTVTDDLLHIHKGTVSVIRAKAERTSREMSDAPIIELIPDRIAALTPVAWTSLSLQEDRARRFIATITALVGLVLAGFSFVVWFFASIATIQYKSDLTEAKMRASNASIQIVSSMERLRVSPVRTQLMEFLDLNDGLLNLGGYLQVYEIKNEQARWRAVVPANVTAGRIEEIGGQSLEAVEDGVAIGNEAEARLQQKN